MSDAEITNQEGHALSEAVKAFDEHGIDFRLPWDCSLDDLEQERFEALVKACRAYHRAMALTSAIPPEGS